jgi:hypothetical protein
VNSSSIQRPDRALRGLREVEKERIRGSEVSVMAETIRQAARRQVKEATAVRQRSWAAREEQLSKAAVDVVASIAARDRAEKAAANSIGTMLALDVSLTEVGERCGLSLKEVTRLKRRYLESPVVSPREVVDLSGPSQSLNGGQRS